MSRGLGRSFRVFLAGQTVNGLGTMVSGVALPLVAVQRLHASTFDVGLLEAAEWAPALLIGVHVGALVDRHQRRARPAMMSANVGQAIAVAAVPATAASGLLTFPVLLAAAMSAGLFGVFFQTGYSPYLRQLVARDDYVAANSQIQAGQSAAQITGPALGGALAEAFGAATALFADAASFLVSFASLLAITTASPATVPKPRQRLRKEVAEGLRYLSDSQLLRTIAAATALANLSLTAIGAVEVVFLVRDVHVTARAIGLLFAVGGIGGLSGAVISHKLTRKMGTERIARTALAVTAPAALLIPLTHYGATIVLFAIGGFMVSFGIALASVTFASLRLQYTPSDLQARISSSSRVLNAATIPAGALLGGALGQLLGNRSALYAMAAAYTAFSFALVRSPLRVPAEVLHEPETV